MKLGGLWWEGLKNFATRLLIDWPVLMTSFGLQARLSQAIAAQPITKHAIPLVSTLREENYVSGWNVSKTTSL